MRERTRILFFLLIVFTSFLVFLYNQNIKISVGRSCELVMQKFEKVVKEVAPESVASA
jgi:hypothetical protein